MQFVNRPPNSTTSTTEYSVVSSVDKPSGAPIAADPTINTNKATAQLTRPSIVFIWTGFSVVIEAEFMSESNPLRTARDGSTRGVRKACLARLYKGRDGAQVYSSRSRATRSGTALRFKVLSVPPVASLWRQLFGRLIFIGLLLIDTNRLKELEPDSFSHFAHVQR